MTDMKHMDYLEDVAARDVEELRRKEQTYRGSWKRRGGVGAFMMMARKWDRLEVMMTDDAPGIGGHYDIFARIVVDASGRDGTVLAEIRDLRCYLLLVEAEMTARGVVPMDRTVRASDHVDVSVQETGSTPMPESVLITRTIDPAFEKVVSDGKIYEQGRTPRPAHGEGYDGRIIRVGDACTCALPGEKTFDTRLIDVRADGLPAVEYGGAPGGLVTQWKNLRKQPVESTEERTVPRLREQGAFAPSRDTPSCGDGLADDHARQRTPEDGAQHASLAPWVVDSDYFQRNEVSVVMREKFWSLRAPGVHVLEPRVVSDELPRVLHLCYEMRNHVGDVSWMLRMSRVPADARDMFPRLRREKNAVEHAELPEWQQRMYEWREGESKHVLMERYAAWTGETP